MAIPLVYNWRNVLRRRLSTATTAIGIALPVAILIAALALASGIRAALVQTGSPDNALVLRKGADSELVSGLGRAAVDVIRAHPAVALGADGRALVSPEVVVCVNKDRLGQPGSSNVTIRGTDPIAVRVRRGLATVEGRMFTPGTDELIVGSRIARRFAGCAIGDRLRLEQRDFTVVGRFTAGGSAFESEIWGDNSTLQPVLRGDVFQSVTLRLRDPSQFAVLKRDLEGDPRLTVSVQHERDFYEGQSHALATTLRVAGILITLIMAVGALFGAMNAMYAAVGARTREIATLMVLGFPPGAVRLSFLAESLMVSLLGGALGCLLALPLNGIVTSTTNFSNWSEVAFAFRITPGALAVGLGFALLVGLVGGLLPARRAGRGSLASGLRAT
jgi:ABC-type lipoprotein release transport system permease subunit